MDETVRVVICDSCGRENEFGIERCSCGQLLSMLRPVIKKINIAENCELDTNEPIQKETNLKQATISRKFKRCRACRTKNYIVDDVMLHKCSVCNAELYFCRVETETEDEEDVNLDNDQNFNSDQNTQFEEETCEKAGGGELKLKAINYDKELRITNSVVLGRWGSVEPEFFEQCPYVSRNHCRIFADCDVWYVEDCGSKGGTRVNGELVTNKHLLSCGDVLSLSNVHFEVEI